MATILSAQSTDKLVNEVTPKLFARYPTAADYAAADRAELEELIKPTGFFRNKTDSLIKLGQALVERYDGEVPGKMVDLVTLPGIGRKTANVILGNAFGVPGITVDTHFQRLVGRWQWTDETDPVKIEHAVGALIERREWTMLSHRMIFHGRRVCHARKPACGACRWPATARPTAPGRPSPPSRPSCSRAPGRPRSWRWPGEQGKRGRRGAGRSGPRLLCVLAGRGAAGWSAAVDAVHRAAPRLADRRRAGAVPVRPPRPAPPPLDRARSPA